MGATAPADMAAGSPAGGGGRPRGDDRGARTRQRLVEAAADMVLEHYHGETALRHVFSFLTPAEVAERAGVTRGMLYHYWGDGGERSAAFERFLDEVSEHLWNSSAASESLADLARALPGNLSDLILALSRFELERMRGTDRTRQRASHAMTVNGSRPPASVEETVLRVTALYSVLGSRLGFEPVPPLGFDDVAFAVMCLFDGFALMQNVMPDRVHRDLAWVPQEPLSESFSAPPGGPPMTWPLFGVAIEGIIRNMLRPVAAPTH
jgi:AcrR family transcriptional regulator